MYLLSIAMVTEENLYSFTHSSVLFINEGQIRGGGGGGGGAVQGPLLFFCQTIIVNTVTKIVVCS